MRIARLLTPDGPITGELDEGVIHTDNGSYEVDVDGRLLPPATPSALYCVGRNFTETIEQREYERPEVPDFFIKPPTSLLGHEQSISYPDFTEQLTYAGELTAIVKERCRNLSPEEVSEAVLGYTIMNDLDALDQQGRTARKAFDGSGPLGPWIETGMDPYDINMWTDISGERRQESNTDLMLFDPYEIISYLSRRITLRPGDAISFGSPANPGHVEPGDVIEITYEDIGTLRNTIRDSDRS